MQAYLSLVAGALLSYNVVLPSVWVIGVSAVLHVHHSLSLSVSLCASEACGGRKTFAETYTSNPTICVFDLLVRIPPRITNKPDAPPLNT